MNLQESMKIFMRITETGSFTKAAQTLGLPKASVSTSLSMLESKLQTRLLQRTTRSVQLTEEGRQFYERCSVLLSDFDEVQNMFQKNSSQIKGRIRIDMPSIVARTIVIPNLHHFYKRHPDIEIELSATDRKVDLIHEGFDCVIRSGPLHDSGLIAKNLGHHTIVNCASSEYIKRFGLPKTIESLKNHQLIDYVPVLGMKSSGFDYTINDKSYSLHMKSILIVNNTESYLAGCLAGLGIIQVPLNTIAPYLKNKKVIEILPKYRTIPMSISILYPHKRNQAKRVQVFLEWLENIIKKNIG
jgi:DNA-binding transcriptional LysR family regulator